MDQRILCGSQIELAAQSMLFVINVSSRVDGAHHSIEAPRNVQTPCSREPVVKGPQKFKRISEKRLRNGHVPATIRIRQRVLRSRRCIANAQELACVVPQGVADIVQGEAVGKLRIEQRDDMRPGRKPPGALVDAVLARKFSDKACRNQLAHLLEYGNPLSAPARGQLWDDSVRL